MPDRACYDLVIVGAGIVGLAHALAAVKRGLSVCIVERDAQANGASIRNFGFVTVTGQQRGRVWNLARQSARIWAEVAPQAGIPIEQRGLVMAVRTPEAAAVIDAFLDTEMGEGCARLSAAQLAARHPQLRAHHGALVSDHDLRVDSREAIPRLARWLAEAHGVHLRFGTAVRHVSQGLVETLSGPIRGGVIIVCPGDEGGAALYPDLFAQRNITRCKLQMMRLADPGWRMPSAVMSDLGMVRYLGYAELPEAAALRARMEREESVALAHGIHLIVTQNRDGSLIVGDSHSYAATPDPFSSAAIDAAILAQFERVLGAAPPVLERWCGTYASGDGHSIVCTPEKGVRLVVVTSGTGASTSFALAEEVIGGMFD